MIVFDDIEPVRPTTIRDDVETGYGQTSTIKPRPNDNDKAKPEDNTKTEEKMGIDDNTQPEEKSQFEKTEIDITENQVPH